MQSSQYIQSFINHIRYEKRYSEHSVIAYEGDLKDFIDYIEGEYNILQLSEVNQSIVRSWLADLRNGGKRQKKLQPKSISRKISSLRVFYKFLIKTEQLETTPMSFISVPKVGKRLPAFIKEEEASQLIKAVSVASEDWKSLNAKLLIILFYNTGMRLSELINLKEVNLDFGRRQIKVMGKGGKERSIPISPQVIKDIEDYKAHKRKEFSNESEQLLVTEKGKKLYPKYAYSLVNIYLGKASTIDKKSPHILRHSFATHLMNAGADLNAVKELLGHSSLAATQIYTHNSIEKLKDVHKKAHPKA